MRLFKSKPDPRIAKLETLLAQANEDRDNLAKMLRDQDQLIFNMAQKTDFNQMRPIFQKLCESANVRMKIEHNRITQLLIPELNKTYGKQ